MDKKLFKTLLLLIQSHPEKLKVYESTLQFVIEEDIKLSRSNNYGSIEMTDKLKRYRFVTTASGYLAAKYEWKSFTFIQSLRLSRAYKKHNQNLQDKIDAEIFTALRPLREQLHQTQYVNKADKIING